MARRSPRRPGPTASRSRCASERRIRGVAPGQSVVLYDGTRVVGSATITKATSRREASKATSKDQQGTGQQPGLAQTPVRLAA